MRLDHKPIGADAAKAAPSGLSQRLARRAALSANLPAVLSAVASAKAEVLTKAEALAVEATPRRACRAVAKRRRVPSHPTPSLNLALETPKPPEPVPIKVSQGQSRSIKAK